MSAGPKDSAALMLTEEEAFAILGLCLTSPQALDTISESALRKLADYCAIQARLRKSHHLARPQPVQAAG